MVAAWISAETGVGPSIASGSQVCSRNCADLPIAPMNSSRQISGQRVGVPAEEVDGLAGERRAPARRWCRNRSTPVIMKTAKMPSAKPKSPTRLTTKALIAAALAVGLVVPEADQQIAREADALPAEEQLHEVVGRHQHQHGEGEQRQVGEEARPVRILGHVADRVEVHERRDGRDHHQHHRGQRVDAQRPVDLEIARDDPGEQPDARVLMAEADVDEGDPGQHHGDEQERGGDELGRARAGGRRLGRRA